MFVARVTEIGITGGSIARLSASPRLGMNALFQSTPWNQAIHALKEYLPTGFTLLAVVFQVRKCRLDACTPNISACDLLLCHNPVDLFREFLAGPRNDRKGGDDEGEGRLCYNRRIQPRFHTCNSTMQLPEISFEIDDRVAFVILKGEDDLNRVTAGMYEDLSVAVDSIIDDGNVRVVVVTGEGSVFSGGTEEAVREMREGGGEGMTGASGHIARLPMPVIAAINGDALGLGLELALACDLRVASDEAAFAMDQIRFEMMPWDGGTQRLPRLVGRGRGAAMVLTGMTVAPRRPWVWGWYTPCSLRTLYKTRP